MSSIGPFVGEHLALDLANTSARLPSIGRVDMLDTVHKLRIWIGCEGARLPATTTAGLSGLRRADLEPLRAVRADAIAAIGDARQGLPPTQQALRGLNDAQRAAPMYRELSWDGAAIVAREQREGALGLRLAAYLAEATACLLADPKITTVKKCAAHFCVLWLLPTHPNRRWCAAKVCGNRIRVARHYQRHKQDANT